MSNKIKSFALLSIIFLGILSNLTASDKLYIDPEGLDSRNEAFHIHMGNNIWLETGTVHRDVTGLYTFESDICMRMNTRTQTPEYQRRWKCPYCYMFWPIGTACKNTQCPSRYRNW